MKVAQVIGVDGTKLRCLVSSASQPNVPALVRFDDATLVLKNISAQPTAEYGDEETRLQGTYRDGGTVRPLRWNAEAAESFSDLTLIFIGDVNRDGNINIADVMGAVVVAIGNDDAAPHLFDHDAADFNNDTTVNITDVMAIVSYVLNGR